ncbi:DUF4349 domain-containing protein [Kineothrix sp. MSJ-39]|uniref:DUF4349 domain-containing protein n=1 Tax=Kineothrix sp. MSJ-39 TaxID=2841533 RepID=UPI001C12544B|nr:DUF4349 domain-containing protein [Kineothrix sp. MSJ-39]MBU5430953.1 DUF4349 domain-containing protein [Kineothrix sp. MSJ-39]
MKKRLLCVLGLALLLTGCGSSYDSSASNKAVQTMAASDMMTEEAVDNAASEDVYEYDAVAQSSGDSSGATTAENVQKQVEQGRKLIRRMDIGVETQSFDKLLSQIDKKVAELGGYIESSNTYGSSYGYEGNRSADYTVRVPADKMDEMVTMVSENANVTRKSESTDDVTLSYVDTKSRKETLEVEQERLMALMEKAESVDAIIALETRLTEVRYQIQSMESQLRTYDNQVDYATIHLSVEEVTIYTPDTQEPKSDLQRMTDGFVTSVKRVLQGIKNFLIDVVIALPYLLIWALIIAVIVLVIRTIVKKSKKKRERKLAQKLEKFQKQNEQPDAAGQIKKQEEETDKKEP